MERDGYRHAYNAGPRADDGEELEFFKKQIATQHLASDRANRAKN